MISVDDLRIDGQRFSVPIGANIVGGEIHLSMEGASEVTIDIDDPDRVLLLSGVLTRARRGRVSPELRRAAWDRLGKARLTIPFRSDDSRVPRAQERARFRLAGYEKQDDSLQLTFESEIPALMRQHKRRIKASRDNTTRAQFIRRLTDAVKEEPITARIFQEDVRQPIKDTDEKDLPIASKGLRRSSRLTVRGQAMDRDQARNANLVLEQADEDGAGERATLALLEACIVEGPDFRNPIGGDSSSVGILQLLDIHLGGSTSTSGGRRDVKLVAHIFLTKGFYGKGGAIGLARRNPDWLPGEVAQAVQGSGHPERYEQNRKDAERILAAWGGASRSITQRESFQFEVEENENYWDTAQRLAQEVNWHAFEAGNVFYYGADADFIAARPVLTVCERPVDGHDGIVAVGPLNFSQHYNQRASDLRFTAPIDIFECPAGSNIEVTKLGPADGRWLVLDIRQRFGSEDAEIVLMQPSPAKPEPTARLREIATDDPEAGGSERSWIVEVAKDALKRASTFRYQQVRPYPDSMRLPVVPISGGTVGKVLVDCSSFVTLVYKEAGVSDPNDMDYNGQGNTVTLWNNGTRTDHPQPGDLCFYGSTTQAGGSAHVNIYIGQENGQPMCINMGGSGLRKLPRDSVRNDFVAYKSYPLDSVT